MIIADAHTIINTQGIRFVERIDSTYSGISTSYRLRVVYRGDSMDFKYPDEPTRDAQFTALTKAMTAPPKRVQVEVKLAQSGER